MQCVFQVNEIENVYDEVDEEEYTKVVRKRQLQDDWIVDNGIQLLLNLTPMKPNIPSTKLFIMSSFIKKTIACTISFTQWPCFYYMCRSPPHEIHGTC